MEQDLMLYNTYKISNIEELAWYESIYKEIWIDHEYSRYGVEIKPGDIVVDCGANVGFFTLYALNKGAKHVYSIECDVRNIESLKYNLKNTNTTIFKERVGSEEGSTDIDQIFKNINVPFINFIKIDIEWAEYDLLLNITPTTMKRIDNWVIEFHDIYTHYEKVFNIMEKFSKNGFDVNFEQIHKETNLALLYVKRR